jgi:hypothetical protein
MLCELVDKIPMSQRNTLFPFSGLTFLQNVTDQKPYTDSYSQVWKNMQSFLNIKDNVMPHLNYVRWSEQLYKNASVSNCNDDDTSTPTQKNNTFAYAVSSVSSDNGTP